MRRYAPMALMAVAALLLPACAGDSGKGAAGTTTSSTTAATAQTGAAPLGQATARGGGHAPVEDLYVVRGGAGTTVRTASTEGGTRITLEVADDVLVFDDRPNRGASHMSAADFVARWASFGFAADPPNAALSGTAGDGSPIDLAVELTDPSWDPDHDRLAVTATPIGDDRGRGIPGRLEDVSLFVDSVESTIQVQLVNLAQIPLQIQSATPDISSWTSDDGPSIGWDFGEVSANGPTLDIGYSNPNPGTAFTAQLLLVGDYQNQWQLSLNWDPEGYPTATLTQLDGQGIAVEGLPAMQGTPAELPDLDPAGGQAASYEVVFDQQ